MRKLAPGLGHGQLPAHAINWWARVLLLSTGTVSWLAGGLASFTSGNGGGAAALIVSGVFCEVLALTGRWPTRISLSGHEISWDDVNQAVNSQIRVAERIGESDDALAELESLRERLDVLQRTGTVPAHPAENYDQAVAAAIRRVLPPAEVTRHGILSPDTPDFLVRYGQARLLVETKWRQDTARPFAGSTLPRLLERLPGNARLLIVVNTSEPPPPSGRQLVREALGERGEVVRWRDERDDADLREALRALAGMSAADTAPS
jgi:hypothetical protein